jgi:hypothetical protein
LLISVTNHRFQWISLDFARFGSILIYLERDGH